MPHHVRCVRTAQVFCVNRPDVPYEGAVAPALIPLSGTMALISASLLPISAAAAARPRHGTCGASTQTRPLRAALTSGRSTHIHSASNNVTRAHPARGYRVVRGGVHSERGTIQNCRGSYADPGPTSRHANRTRPALDVTSCKSNAPFALLHVASC